MTLIALLALCTSARANDLSSSTGSWARMRAAMDKRVPFFVGARAATMRPIRLGLAIIVLSCAAACVPIPYPRRSSPSIHGVLMDGSSLVAGAPIHLTVGKFTCESNEPVAYTRDDGSFEIGGTWEIVPVIWLLPGDWGQYFAVCFPHGGQEVLAYSWCSFGAAGSPLSLRCDASHPQKDPCAGVCAREPRQVN